MLMKHILILVVHFLYIFFIFVAIINDFLETAVIFTRS